MGEAKGLIAVSIVTLIILIGGVFLLSKGGNTPQKPVKVDQSILVNSDSHQTTNASRSVTIVEFGDYRCPACKQAYPAIKQIVKNYGDKINFVFRNYAFLPDSAIDKTPNASFLAANAAECAADLGKFWEMHDYLYQNQPPETDIKMYNVDTLTQAAASMDLDTKKFKECLTNKADNNRVQNDFAAGQLAHVSGTPSFFVNGQLLPGVPAYNDFKSIIDQLLK